MGMDLARKDFGTTPEYFIAGATIRIAKAVKVAGADIPAHSPVTLDGDGKLAAVTKATAASVYGLLPEAAVAEEETVVYLSGEYFADSLALTEGVTAADVEVPLRNIGIFLR